MREGGQSEPIRGCSSCCSAWLQRVLQRCNGAAARVTRALHERYTMATCAGGRVAARLQKALEAHTPIVTEGAAKFEIFAQMFDAMVLGLPVGTGIGTIEFRVEIVDQLVHNRWITSCIVVISHAEAQQSHVRFPRGPPRISLRFFAQQGAN